MNIIIDLEAQQVVDDFGSRNPANPISVKAQDTPLFAVYFVQRGTTFDLGPSPGIRFGLFVPGNPNPLVGCNTFTYSTDTLRRTCYRGYPVFNTTALAAAIGINATLSATGEFRYQTSAGTIARTADLTFNVNRVLLSETILDYTTAAFTVPAIGSNVTIAIGSTAWLKAGLILSVGAGAGAYTVVSITDATHFVAQNNGGAGNAASGTNIPSGTTVGIAPATVISTYPDPSVIEITPHKGAVNGYAGLDGSGLVLNSKIPVDSQTIGALANGKIGLSSILAYVNANFTTPAANATVSVTLSSTTNLKAGSYVRIPVAGYYVVQSITDSTHAVLQNNGDPFNAASGVTITSGSVLLPAQAAAGGGGSAGQNAYTATLANFTVPSAGLTVSVNMASTSWLGGSGYVVFIQNAGYYAVSSVTDSTHAVLTNLGYASTNAAPGTVITTGAAVSPGGIKGADSTATGANAYDTTQASFTMPAAAASVNVTISNTGWLGVGQEVYIAGAGYFSVASITSPTVVNLTNSNYPGAATPGSTIASGAHISPAGLIGPTGAGGSGLNAFTTLSANFTQPAVNATVTTTVGTTAWMATGQIIYVSAGGYYSVASIIDLTHVSLTNLGYTGNASPGTTVTGSGTQMVTPGGLIGTTGAGAYTSTTASFVVPAALQSVSISVISTAALLQNQNVYVGTAGYFSVSSVLDSTHFLAINLGSPGNVSSGTTIAPGVGITPAGATGPAINTSGGFSTAADAIAPAGTGEISHIASQTGGVLALKKLKSGTTGSVALTDQGGTTGDILVDVPVDGTTITVSGGRLVASAPASAFDPANGLYWYDDFNWASNTGDQNRYNGSQSGAGATYSGSALYHNSNPGLHILGYTEISTGVTAALTGISYLWGSPTPASVYSVLYGLGALVLKTRIILESTLPGTGIGYVFKWGLGQQGSGGAIYAFSPGQGFWLEYSPDQNSGQWRIGYATTGAATYVNTSTAVAGDTAYNLEIDANTAWTTLTFKINGTVVGTLSSGFPTSVYGSPLWAIGRSAASTTNFKAAIDSFMINYTFTR